jgi:hypothetical protein
MEEKFGVFLGEIGFSEFWGETMKMGVKKGRRWCGDAVEAQRCRGGYGKWWVAEK